MDDDESIEGVNIDIGEDNASSCDGRDLQLEVTNFCIYLGGFGDPPTLELQRYAKRNMHFE